MTGQETFTRLPARRRGFIRRASLWDAGEYLLSVSGTAFSERYRRFYYRDIKALVLRKGPRLGSMGALMLLAFLSLMVSISVAVNPFVPFVMHVFWIAPLTWLIVIMYLNLARSCRVYVYTATSSEELPAILRQSAATRTIPRIINKIHAAQGEFASAYQEASARESGLAESFAPVFTQPPSNRPEIVPAPRQALYGALSFFLVTLLCGAFAFWYRITLLTPHSLLTAKVWFCVLNALGVATGVWALLRVFSIRLFTGLRITIFAGLGLMALRSYSLYFTLLELKVKNRALTETMGGVYWRQWLGTADCALSLLIGITGLVLLTYTWQDTPQPISHEPIADSSVAGGSTSSL